MKDWGQAKQSKANDLPMVTNRTVEQNFDLDTEAPMFPLQHIPSA